MAKRKNTLTIELRPLVMASLKAQADQFQMTPREWLEVTLTTARMLPQGVAVKLDEVQPPVSAANAPMDELPLGGAGIGTK